MAGTLCPEKTQRSAWSLFGKASIEAALCFLVSPLSLGIFRATPSDQQGKGQGARESSLPFPELWGELRFRPATWIQIPELTLPGSVTLISLCLSFLMWFPGSLQNLASERYSTNGGITGCQA